MSCEACGLLRDIIPCAITVLGGTLLYSKIARLEAKQDQTLQELELIKGKLSGESLAEAILAATSAKKDKKDKKDKKGKKDKKDKKAKKDKKDKKDKKSKKDKKDKKKKDKKKK